MFRCCLLSLMPCRASSSYGAHWRFKDHEKSVRVNRGEAESSLGSSVSAVGL